MKGLCYKPDPERVETAEALAPKVTACPRSQQLEKKMIGADYGEVNGDSDDR